MSELLLSGGSETRRGISHAGGDNRAERGAGEDAAGPEQDAVLQVPQGAQPQAEIDMEKLEQELMVMRYTVERLKEIREMKSARVEALVRYYDSLRQEELLRRECVKDKQYPLLWVCCGLGIGALSLVVSSLARS